MPFYCMLCGEPIRVLKDARKIRFRALKIEGLAHKECVTELRKVRRKIRS